MSTPLLQATGPGNVDELLTTTFLNLMPGIRDNVFSSNSLLKYLYKTEQIKKKGGAAISHGILYEANSTAQAYQRYDLLDVTPQDGQTADVWDWRQYAVTVSIDGFLSDVANTGEAQIQSVLENKKYQAEESLSLLLEQELFAATPGPKSLRSLPSIVAASGTEGGINGTTSTWWASTVTTSGSFVAQGRKDLTTLYNALSAKNPSGTPDIIVSSQSELEFYENEIVPQERFNSQQLADIGIRTLEFKGVPWIWSPQAATGTIYVLSNKALEFVVSANRDFTMSPFVKPANQDAKTAQIFLAAALVTSNRRKLGKLTSVTA